MHYMPVAVESGTVNHSSAAENFLGKHCEHAARRTFMSECGVRIMCREYLHFLTDYLNLPANNRTGASNVSRSYRFMLNR